MQKVNPKLAQVPAPREPAALGQSSLERIGNTPLLRLARIGRDLPAVEILGKAEWLNPGGSVKDRAAANIVAQARSAGKLTSGKILLDSTSGNTGIAYAMIAAAQGFPVTLCMPENVSMERKRILHTYGANIVYTDPANGSDGAIRKARELAAERPDLYFYADQYSNDANWQAHYHGTANEIWQLTEGRITLFVAMLGTSGTLVGTARRLKELNPRVRCISLQPDSAFHGIEGTKHMASAIVPKIYDMSLADEGNRYLDRRCLCHGPPPGSRRRLAGRRFVGGGDCRLPASSTAAQERRARGDGSHPAGFGGQIFERAILGRGVSLYHRGHRDHRGLVGFRVHLCPLW